MTAITYKKTLEDLTKGSIKENQFQWLGLAIGIIAKGVEPGTRNYTQVFTTLLNDGEPLPGSLVATLTNLGMDAKEGLEKSNFDLFCMPDKTTDRKERLLALADVSYGLSLGLTINGQDGQITKITDREMLEDLNTISELSQVDPEAELDENDFTNVIEFMVDTTCKYFLKYSE